MNKFKKWLMPIAIVGLLLATLIGCSNAPASLGETFDPSGNPFANRFSDVKDIRAATFVVAASDSEHKYEADYRCDGVADDVQIQAAIDALPASGGSIVLLDGDFVGGTVDINESNVEITGLVGTTYTCTGANPAFQIIGVDNSHVRNIEIDADDTANHCVRVTDDAGTPATNCSIENCIARSATNDNLVAHGGCHGIRFTKNVISGGGDCGIEVSTDCYDVLIEGNRCYENVKGIGAFAHGGETIRRVDIVDNMTYNNTTAGILIGDVGDTEEINVEGNMLYEPVGTIASGAILVQKVSAVSISNNHIYLPEKAGITLREDAVKVTISNNTIDTPTTIGIELYGANCIDIAIEGNVIESAPKGIYLRSTSMATVADNLIDTCSTYGIEIYIANSITISGNTLTACNKGIYLMAAVSKFSISENIINASTNEAISLYVADVTDGSIVGNQLYQGLRGLLLRESDRITVQGNRFEGFDQEGIYLRASHCSVVGNLFKNNGQQADNTYSDIKLQTLGGTTASENIIVGNQFYAYEANKTAYAVEIGAPADDYNVIAYNIIDGPHNPITVWVDTGVHNKSYDQCFDVFTDCLAASVNCLHAAVAGTGALQTIGPTAQPDVPRNISVTHTGVNGGTSEIRGYNARGVPIKEDVAINIGGTAYTNNAFATVSHYTIPDTMVGGDTLALGMSDTLGLSNQIQAAGGVYKVKKNNADFAAANWTANATYDTVSVDDVAAIGAGDDFTVYYRSNLNIVE